MKDKEFAKQRRVERSHWRQRNHSEWHVSLLVWKVVFQYEQFVTAGYRLSRISKAQAKYAIAF